MQKSEFLGKSLSALVFGCDSLGLRLPDDVGNALLDLYIENGGNFLDTARIYSDGLSEGFVGRYLKERHLKDKIFVATKAGHPPLSDMHHSRLSKTDLEEDINTSLRELQTDCIDLLWLHRDDESRPVQEIVDTMNSFIKEGKIKHFGVSNWKSSRIAAANRYAKEENLSPVCASQIQYNIAVHNGLRDETMLAMTDEEFAYYKEEKNLPVFAYSSQAKGFFHKYLAGAPLSDALKHDYLNEENMQMAKTIQSRTEKGETVSQAVLNILMQQIPFPVFPIIGASNTAQLKDILGI